MQTGGKALSEAHTASEGHARFSKWRILDFLRVESVRKRQRGCQLYPRGDFVSVRRSEQFGTGFAGVQSCGSITCPHCGAKIAAERRQEIERAIDGAERQGLVMLFGTLTIRHRLGQSFDALADVVARGWRGVIGGGGWHGNKSQPGDRARFGIVGWVRVWETKVSTATGWHVHVHYLLFVDPAQAPDVRAARYSTELADRIFARWSLSVAKMGPYAPSSAAQDLRVVVGNDAKYEFGKYLTKQMRERSLAFELSSHGTKRGRESVSREPMELLEDAVDGDEESLYLWNEYELGMTGRRTIGWSRGLRDRLEVGEERTDEEIADEEVGTSDDDQLTMTGPAFVKAARSRGFRGELLAVLQDFGSEWAVWWLRERGVHAWVGSPPPS